MAAGGDAYGESGIPAGLVPLAPWAPLVRLGPLARWGRLAPLDPLAPLARWVGSHS
jgi:hypothetical protein